MNLYKVPVQWSVFGTMEIEAESMEKAIEIAKDDETPNPTETDYVYDSLIVFEDEVEEISKDIIVSEDGEDV